MSSVESKWFLRKLICKFYFLRLLNAIGNVKSVNHFTGYYETRHRKHSIRSYYFADVWMKALIKIVCLQCLRLCGEIFTFINNRAIYYEEKTLFLLSSSTQCDPITLFISAISINSFKNSNSDWSSRNPWFLKFLRPTEWLSEFFCHCLLFVRLLLLPNQQLSSETCNDLRISFLLMS